MSSVQTIYGDRSVLITDLYIKIYKYYFPLGTSKTIFFDEINHIVYHPNQKPDSIWGTDFNLLSNWFPLDELRKYKQGYFQIFLKNQTIRPSFSPIDCETAFKVLWNRGLSQSKSIQSQIKTTQPQQRQFQESKQHFDNNQVEAVKYVNQKQKQILEDFNDFDNQVKNNLERIPLKDITNEFYEDSGAKKIQNKYFLQSHISEDVSLENKSASEQFEQNFNPDEDQQFEQLT